MPQSQFRADLKDRDRQHILWYRSQNPMYNIVGVSYVCGDHTLEFNIFPENQEDRRGSRVMLKAIFRNPLNGGGNMAHGFWAMKELFYAFREPDRELQLSFFYDLPQHIASRTALRHIDQGFGHILLMEDPASLSIALIPHEKKHHMMNDGESLCMIFHRHETPPRIYRALQYFMEGVERDNLERPNFYGNHA